MTIHDYDDLRPHELAGLLPMIEEAKFIELREDIRKHGLHEKIVLYDGRILDGRNRYRAGKDIGYQFSPTDFRAFEGTYAEAEAYVFSTNFLRRQLTNKQKSDIIETMIKKYPGDSNRQIARRCGISSHSQVASVRERMNSPNARAAEVRGVL